MKRPNYRRWWFQCGRHRQVQSNGISLTGYLVSSLMAAIDTPNPIPNLESGSFALSRQ